MLCILSCKTLVAQELSAQLNGTVFDDDGTPVAGVLMKIGDTGRAHTDANGHYHIRKLQPGKYLISAVMVGFDTLQKAVKILPGKISTLDFRLKSKNIGLESVNIDGRGNAIRSIRQKPFAITVVDAKKLAGRDIDLNRLMDGQSGIRVQETGGMGSEFNYTVNGLSGKAVKFFVDGVPMESFGSTFSINNFPANTIDRVEVYKGVTPVDLGADALGGAINIITRRDTKNYLDLSQSFGSFGTNRSALSGRWRSQKGFTLQSQAFLNRSDNDYEVWGPTVQVAGPDGRALPGFPRFRRFNDDYRAYALKAEAGFTQVKWADQFLIGFTYSNQNRGIQTGRTMAYVYGDVRYHEDFLMPSLRYSKQAFLLPKMSIDVFGALNRLDGTTTDTSTNKYNWNGDVIAANANGELGGIRASPSVYTFRDRTSLARVNLGYALPGKQQILFNYTFNNTRRQGSDAIATADWTIPFRLPQDMSKSVAGISYENVWLNDRWTNTVFVKYFAYSANATVHDFRGGSTRETFYRQTSDQAFGLGYATKFTLQKQYLVKLSVENTNRLPEAAELLGNGNTILNAPNLQPERSLNANLGLMKTFGTGSRKLHTAVEVFFRNTRNLIWLGEGDLMGTARYENLGRIRSAGVETDLNYQHSPALEISANFTYQDIRNRQRYETTGAENHVYNDRLRNTPYLMANGEVRLFLDQIFSLQNKLSFFAGTHYVHRYYLGWPSLGAPDDKMFIPTQFVQDAGIGYAFSQNRYSINLACRNLSDRQVFDNYLLQKPGRYFSIKLRYLIQ